MNQPQNLSRKNIKDKEFALTVESFTNLCELESAGAPEIQSLVPRIVAAAQRVYDEWEQDEDGNDEFLGNGGVCDQINQEIQEILSGAGFDVIDGGQDGDDHAFSFAVKDGSTYLVDIPANVYEVGSGYTWKKRPNVTITAQDVVISPIRYEDAFGDAPSVRE